jgi:hypothetical protein
MSNKITKFLVLTLFLVIFPLVSYLYLKRGVQFRMDVISELKTKTPMTTPLTSQGNVILDYKNKCTLVDLNANDAKVNQIYGQFKDAKGFQFLSMKNVEENPSHIVPDSASQAYLLGQYPGQQFMLIDSLGNMRKLYKDNDEELKKMVVHITALLPYYNEKKGR